MKRMIGALLLVLALASALTSCAFVEPRPEIKEGEFDFSVTYEYYGEIKTVSGTYVCEYNGLEWALDGGYYRDWSGYIKDGRDEHITVGETADGGEIILVLDFYADYFMGEAVIDESFIPEPYLMIRIYEPDGAMRIVHDAEVLEAHGAKLIGYEYAKPIKNSFGLFK